MGSCTRMADVDIKTDGISKRMDAFGTCRSRMEIGELKGGVVGVVVERMFPEGHAGYKIEHSQYKLIFRSTIKACVV